MPMIHIFADVKPTEITWMYAAGCVILPFVWGLIVEFSFRRLGNKRRKPGAANPHSAEYYQI